MRIQYFWSNEFLTGGQQQSFADSIGMFSAIHIPLWCCAVLVTIAINQLPNVYPTYFFYNKKWRSYYLWPELYKFCAYIFTGTAYYIGTARICYFSYNVLHMCYQMYILQMYAREETRRCHKMKLANKIRDDEYQSAVREVLKISAKQYNKLKMLVFQMS